MFDFTDGRFDQATLLLPHQEGGSIRGRPNWEQFDKAAGSENLANPDQANAHPAVQGQTPVPQLATSANELSVSVLDPHRSTCLPSWGHSYIPYPQNFKFNGQGSLFQIRFEAWMRIYWLTGIPH